MYITFYRLTRGACPPPTRLEHELPRVANTPLFHRQLSVRPHLKAARERRCLCADVRAGRSSSWAGGAHSERRHPLPREGELACKNASQRPRPTPKSWSMGARCRVIPLTHEEEKDMSAIKWQGFECLIPLGISVASAAGRFQSCRLAERVKDRY